jgi:hypothetical protein
MLEREFDQEVAMKIESTTFSTIKIDGTTYQHDVSARRSRSSLRRRSKVEKEVIKEVLVVCRLSLSLPLEETAKRHMPGLAVTPCNAGAIHRGPLGRGSR